MTDHLNLNREERTKFYKSLDWRKSNAQLAREINMTAPALRYWRLKFGRKPHKRGMPKGGGNK